MKYIRIKNDGLIEPNALHLLGASTKDDTKIGQFGSGNKYALAYFIRNGYEPRIFSGKTELVVSTKKEIFRVHEFNVIYIDGQKTSITDAMGKDWEFWQAIREVYCNAIDEGGHSLAFVPEIEPREGETHYYINAQKDVKAFVAEFDNYFAENKKVLFECKVGRIVEKSGSTANIYRRGVRCYNTNLKSVYDYDFNEIEIDENRLVKYSWRVEEKMWDLIFRCDNPELIRTILTQSAENGYIEGSIAEYSSINTSNMSETFKGVLKSTRLAPAGYAGLLKADEIHNHVIIPTRIFNAVKGVLKDSNVGGRFKITVNGNAYRIIEPDKLQTRTLQEANYFLEQVQFQVPYEIAVAVFDNKSVMGAADEGKILISDICLERGVNDVVNTLIEELVHIRHGVKDETRDMQTALITEMINYMKKINSITI